MKGDKEIVGTLKGFDDYVNMVLEDVTELCAEPSPLAAGPRPPARLLPALPRIFIIRSSPSLI